MYSVDSFSFISDRISLRLAAVCPLLRRGTVVSPFDGPVVNPGAKSQEAHLKAAL